MRRLGEAVDAALAACAVDGLDAWQRLEAACVALNWAPSWYRPGKDSPRAIARGFLELLRMRVGVP